MTWRIARDGCTDNYTVVPAVNPLEENARELYVAALARYRVAAETLTRVGEVYPQTRDDRLRWELAKKVYEAARDELHAAADAYDSYGLLT